MMLAMTIPVLVAPVTVHRLGTGRSSQFPTAVCLVALGCLIAAPAGLLTFSQSTPISASWENC